VLHVSMSWPYHVAVRRCTVMLHY